MLLAEVDRVSCARRQSALAFLERAAGRDVAATAVAERELDLDRIREHHLSSI